MELYNDRFSLFVYGTLKSDGVLHNQLKPFILEDIKEGSCKGSLYKSKFGDWPVLVLDNLGIVYGELYIVKIEVLQLLISEEVLYGYSLRWVEITTNSGSMINALLCSWEESKEVGDIISTGIWKN